VPLSETTAPHTPPTPPARCQDEINLRDDLLDAAVAEMRAERQRANDLEQEVAALIDINRMQVDAQKAAAR